MRQAQYVVRSFFRCIVLCCAMLGLSLGLAVHAQAALLEDVARAMSLGAQVNADFSMVRQLRSVHSVIASSGNLLFFRSQGLIWNQVSPFPNVMTVTKKKITMEIPGLGIPQVIESSQAPAAFRYTDTILSMMSVRPEDLRRYFDVTAQGTLSQWRLVLVPRSGPLVRLFQQIVLTGNNGILATVVMNELSGDVTTVTFSRVQVLARVNESDRRRLGQ